MYFCDTCSIMVRHRLCMSALMLLHVERENPMQFLTCYSDGLLLTVLLHLPYVFTCIVTSYCARLV